MQRFSRSIFLKDNDRQCYDNNLVMFVNVATVTLSQDCVNFRVKRFTSTCFDSPKFRHNICRCYPRLPQSYFHEIHLCLWLSLNKVHISGNSRQKVYVRQTLKKCCDKPLSVPRSFPFCCLKVVYWSSRVVSLVS